jgi:hypothetical protein
VGSFLVAGPVLGLKTEKWSLIPSPGSGGLPVEPQLRKVSILVLCIDISILKRVWGV